MIPSKSISAGPGLRRLAGRNGVVISRYKGVQTGRRLRTPRALFVSQTDPTKIIVSAGAIRNVVPTLGGDELTDIPPPEGTITSTGFVYLDATIDEDGEVTALIVTFGASVPDDDGDYLSLAISIDDAITATLPAGRHYYDLELERVADGFVRRIVTGRAQVSGEVTR